MNRCYYCDFPKRRSADGTRRETLYPILVPVMTDGYETDEQVYAHPSCTKEHE